MKILITGATGMVGSEVVRQALLQPQFEEIILLVRRPADYSDPRVKVIVHHDFLDYASLKETFKNIHAMIWCLGIPQSMVTKEEYHVITYDYTLNAAQTLLEVNPAATFVFVSGGGADSTEKSRITFAREKGKTENALMRLSFNKLVIARPGGIYPIVKPKNVPFAYKLFYPFFPLFKLIMPGRVITSVELAKVLLILSEKGSEQIILENGELKALLPKNI